jgi:hypothetical protein
MKYKNGQERRYLDYGRLYADRDVRCVRVYCGGKVVVVEKIVRSGKECSRNSAYITGCSL